MYQKYKSSGGLDVIVSPMDNMMSVSLGIWIGVGGRYESREESGISHMVEHMLFKGTKRRTAKELKQAIEGVGGAFNGFTSDEATCYMVKVPAKYIELGLDVLADMVTDPLYDADDLDREKFVVCEEIKMYRDQPSEHVLDVLGGIMWPDDALGRSLTGTITNVKRFKRQQLIDFGEKYYHPSNMGVVAAGKIDPGTLYEISSSKLNGHKRRRASSFNTPVPREDGPRIKVLKGGTQQSHIAMGFYGKARNAKERFASKLLNLILGGNMSSRLFEELREKYGLCYDISSAYKRHSDIGEIVIHAGVDSSSTYKAVIAVLDELKRVKDLGVTEEELLRAGKYAKGQFTLAMESTAGRMTWLGDRHIIHGRIPEIEDVLRRIESVTVKDIARMAEKIFVNTSANLAVIGKMSSSERSRIKKEMSRL